MLSFLASLINISLQRLPCFFSSCSPSIAQPLVMPLVFGYISLRPPSGMAELGRQRLALYLSRDGLLGHSAASSADDFPIAGQLDRNVLGGSANAFG
jgi:hypothetical protein